jgi:anti-sigma factor RsiW
MGAPLDQFDAPELKSAVKRLYAAERAPAGLRQRVEAILRAGEPQARPVRIDPAVMGQVMWQVRWQVKWQRAAAAIIVVGLAGLIIRVAYERNHPVGGQTLLAMVKTHDFCCRDGNPHQHRDIPQASFVLMGQTLAGRIKEPVLAADMGDGWKFVGAAMCAVNGKPSAHLVYRRNGQWLSIFSIPAASCDNVREGAIGGEKINDHMIAGFAQTGGVYCIVGSCPKKGLQLEEIQQLLRKHQGDLIAPRATSSVAMVELLQQR